MSDDLYYKVGVLLQDYVHLATVANPAGETGQSANLAMRLTLNGTGNQATTGITVSEVSAANNPGLYLFSCNATTSFVSVVGDYALNIRWTSDTTYEFNKTYRVNTTGLPPGTSGDLSFTAAISNGRITDGTSALTGASIYLRTPAGVLYTSTTSAATGLWGPVYIPSSMTGTWPLTIQLSGYALASSSLTVSSTAITGPLADIALTAVTTGSGLTLSELRAYGRLQIKDVLGTKSDTMLTSGINDALANLGKAHGAQWNWLKRIGSININPIYSTGTLTLTNNATTCVLATGTWPTYADNGFCKIQVLGKWYRITSGSKSGQSVSLTDTFYETTGSTYGYTLYQDTYALASDCLRFGRMFPGMFWGNEPNQEAYETILSWYNVNSSGQNYPRSYGLANNNHIIIFPYPTSTHDLRYLYYAQPATLVNLTDQADWDPMHLEVLQRAIDHQLAIRFGSVLAGNVQQTLETYNIVLNRAMATDKDSPKRQGLIGGNRRSDIGDRRLPSIT